MIVLWFSSWLFQTWLLIRLFRCSWFLLANWFGGCILSTKGSSRIISSFPRSVTRNLVGMFHFPIFRFNQVQCLMTPDFFLVPSTFSGMMFLSRGARAIFHFRTNFLSMKVPSAPESIRAFVLNHMLAFLLFPCTSNGTINDLLFSFASSTGEMEMESGAGANIKVGRFFKNLYFWGHWQVCFSCHRGVLYILPWFWHRHQRLWYKQEEDGLEW